MYVCVRVYSHLKTLQSYYNIFWRVCQVFYCTCCHELAPSGMRKSGSGTVYAWILCGTALACGVFGGFVCGMLGVRCQIEVKRPVKTQTAHPDLSYIYKTRTSHTAFFTHSNTIPTRQHLSAWFFHPLLFPLREASGKNFSVQWIHPDLSTYF